MEKKNKVLSPIGLLIMLGLTFACSEPEPLAPSNVPETRPETLDAKKSSNVNARGGLKIFLESTIDFNEVERTITLPLFKGYHNGEDIYYIITASSDRDDARESRGVNWAPRLVNALGTIAVQEVALVNGIVNFPGTVDFSPQRVVVPGPGGFPPAKAEPGSIGDAEYSPLISMGNGIVLNAPQLANGSGLHDSVEDINFDAMTVTIKLVDGFYGGDEIFYISTDVSDFGTAALEEATYAPNMNAAPGVGSNDGETSARAAITPFVNGTTGINNPERQGLNSALMGEGDPLNVTEVHPRNRGQIPIYTPLWDVHPARWTDQAIASGQRVRIDDHDDIAEAFEDGLLESVGAGPANPELGGLRAADFIVNCPIMALR